MASRGLGRGFGSLIPTEGFEEAIDERFDPTAQLEKEQSEYRTVAVADIFPDENQPRRKFDEESLKELADSIRIHGVIQPLVVLDRGDGRYEIIAGERRWRAAKHAEVAEVPCIVRSAEGHVKLEMSLVENIQRKDLNPIEIATAYAKMRDQFNMNLKEISKRIGFSVPSICNTLRLLSLPEEVKCAMIDNNLTEGQVRPLLSATKEEILQVLPNIIKENWSARKVEQYMVTLRAKKEAAALNRENASISDDPVAIESEKRAEGIGAKLGVKVRIHASTKGSGSITLKFKDEREFERLCTILTS